MARRPAGKALHTDKVMVQVLTAVAEQLGRVVVMARRPAGKALHTDKVMVQVLTAVAQQPGLVVSVTTKKSHLEPVGR